MNEGVGSSTVIVIIMVFIAVVSAYMAYNVNYTKAFRMKNKIISLYEEYDGECYNSTVNGELKSCQDKIRDYAKQLGYSTATLDCDTNILRPTHDLMQNPTEYPVGYCEYKVKKINVHSSSDDPDVIDEGQDGFYYRIITRIDIRIPIIQNVLQLRILNITGDTKQFSCVRKDGTRRC
ncbi:MAG: hypothetical protein J6X28_02705 [Bacilli bacterium]|nr:hypothetical protein [Bacilli bacterium]